MPGVRGAGFVAVAKRCQASVADKEQIAEHLNLRPLLARAEQGRDGHVEMFAEQIEEPPTRGR